MWKSILTALIAGLAVQQSALGQPISSADVNIVSVTGTATPQSFTCTAVINNQNDDASAGTQVIVLMPLQVRIFRARVSGGPGHCRVLPGSGVYRENAICDLGSLPQGPTVTRTVTVTSTPSTAGAGYPPSCGAFVYSAIGDINKTNNYKASQ